MRPTSVESPGPSSARADDFDLRIHHLDAAGTVRIEFGLAVHHEALAFLEAPFQICAVKKSRVQRPEPSRTIT